MASTRRIHWSDQCMTLVRVPGGRPRVWRQDKSRRAPKHAEPTLPGGGGSVTIRGCVSYGCMHIGSGSGTLSGEGEITHCHPESHRSAAFRQPSLKKPPVYMNDTAPPHRARVVVSPM